ncbi:hypothetical protein C8J57DRAFT_1602829 [Mycena rebaudengoi]|nr:hypothetical protein C8J57DRAFT_1602829 [Mycena rebaudengoi]
MTSAMPSFKLDPWSYDDSLCCFRSVSRHWMHAADGEHVLWSRILIDQNTPVGFIASRLSKSGSLPLSIHIHIISRPFRVRLVRYVESLADFVSSFCNEMQPFVVRWRTVTIHSPTADSSTILIPALAVLNPTTLDILNLDMQFAGPAYQIPSTPLPFQSALSSLTCMTFRNGFSNWTSLNSYHALRCLHIADLPSDRFNLKWSTLFALFTMPVNLTHLTIRHVETSSVQYVLPPPSIVLANVTHFQLAARTNAAISFMPALHFPSLSKIHLDIEGQFVMARLCLGSPELIRGVRQLCVDPRMHFTCRDRLEALVGLEALQEESIDCVCFHDV